MKKRKWIYVQSPSAYEISCDKCGGKVEWSEYEKMVWCQKCQIDTPGNEGIFSGPIPLEACKLFGISFDRIDLKTGGRLYMTVTKKGNKVIYRRGLTPKYSCGTCKKKHRTELSATFCCIRFPLR